MASNSCCEYDAHGRQRRNSSQTVARRCSEQERRHNPFYYKTQTVLSHTSTLTPSLPSSFPTASPTTAASSELNLKSTTFRLAFACTASTIALPPWSPTRLPEMSSSVRDVERPAASPMARAAFGTTRGLARQALDALIHAVPPIALPRRGHYYRARRHRTPLRAARVTAQHVLRARLLRGWRGSDLQLEACARRWDDTQLWCYWPTDGSPSSHRAVEALEGLPTGHRMRPEQSGGEGPAGWCAKASRACGSMGLSDE